MKDYQLYCSSEKILELKIANNGKLLVAGSEDYYLYLYQLHGEKFELTAAKK